MRYISVTSLGKPNNLHIKEGASPSCEPDEVLIKTAYIGIGGIDAIMRRGDLGELNPQPPFTPGLEVAGEIIQIGSKVTGLTIGDRVAALLLLKMGGYAEIIACKASSVITLPAGMALADGASLVNPTTTVVGLDIVQPLPGETLVVTGAAGGLGSAIGQVAKALYPKTKILGVVRSKRQTEMYLGFDEVLDAEAFTALIEKDSHYNVIMESVGGDLRRTCLKGLAPQGRMLLLGNVSGDTTSLIPSQDIWLKSLQISGLNLGYLNSIDPLRVKAAAQKATALSAATKINLTPAKTFKFDDIVQAHEYLERSKNHGRIVLRV